METQRRKQAVHVMTTENSAQPDSLSCVAVMMDKRMTRDAAKNEFAMIVKHGLRCKEADRAQFSGPVVRGDMKRGSLKMSVATGTCRGSRCVQGRDEAVHAGGLVDCAEDAGDGRGVHGKEVKNAVIT